MPPKTSGLEMEWDDSGRKGMAGQKKKTGKANEKKVKSKKAKDKEVNGEEGKTQERGYPNPTRGRHQVSK